MTKTNIKPKLFESRKLRRREIQNINARGITYQNADVWGNGIGYKLIETTSCTVVLCLCLNTVCK